MKVSKEDLKQLFEQRSEEYLSAFNVTLQRLKEDISKMIEKEELIN